MTAPAETQPNTTSEICHRVRNSIPRAVVLAVSRSVAGSEARHFLGHRALRRGVPHQPGIEGIFGKIVISGGRKCRPR
jgi:hypothetical protein